MAIWCKFSHHVPCLCSLEFQFDLINLSCDTSLFPSHKHSLSHSISTVTFVFSSLSILLTVPWQFWGSGSLVESKWCHYIMIEPDNHLNHCFLHPYWTYIMCLSTLMSCFGAYDCSLKQLFPQYLGQILGFWVTCGVKMMSLRHGWGRQPNQTASHIHIIHIQSV